MLHRDRVPHGVDIRYGGLHPLVHHDAVPDAQRQSRVLRQRGIRGHADGQHHHPGVERRAVLQQHVHAAVLFRKALHRAAQDQPDAVAAHLAVDQRGHVRIKGVHQLPGPLDDGDIHPQLPQVFRQLQADEAAACQHG